MQVTHSAPRLISKNDLFIFLAFYLGCALCFALQLELHWSAILSAATLDFLCTFVPLPKKIHPKDYQISFCTGTFAGMSSVQIIGDYHQVFYVSLIGLVLFIFVKPFFNGIGGRMGAIAFLATTLWLCVRIFS